MATYTIIFIPSKKDDIIIEKSGGSPSQPVGRVLFYDLERGLTLCNNFTAILRAKPDINSKYACFALFSLYQNGSVLKFQNQTTGIINLKLESYLKDTLIPLPPIPEQKRIVELLDRAQGLIDRRKEQIACMDSLVQSLFYEMFGDPVKNEKGWDVGRISDITLKTQYGTSEKSDDVDGSVPMLRMNNITYSGGWDFKSIKCVHVDEKDREKYFVHKGEILFNRTNSKELVGKTAVYREDTPMAFAGYLVKLIPNARANSEYISAYLNSKHGKSILLGMAKSIVGMANINAEELKSIKILIPPISLQNDFADKVGRVLSMKTQMSASLAELEHGFNALMQESFG